MVESRTFAELVSNPHDMRGHTAKWVAGIIGENPSRYAKSPSIWNPVLHDLGIDAVYLPFDLERSRLEPFIDALRHEPRMKGISVTMPYKTAVLPFLDDIEPKARAIGAVNVVVRRPDGALLGANTDGSGAVTSLCTVLPGQRDAFLPNLHKLQVLLLGAGGAARAVAAYLVEAIGPGHLVIANRSLPAAEGLAMSVRGGPCKVATTEEGTVGSFLDTVDLIINATTKGQSGVRTLPDGLVTCLEPYSALALANPASFPSGAAADPSSFYAAWFNASWPDVVGNHAHSARLMSRLSRTARVMDLIYAPLESTLLRQARLSGHQVMNGKGMNICQAADALFHWVFRDHFEAAGQYSPDTYQRILDRMSEVW